MSGKEIRREICPPLFLLRLCPVGVIRADVIKAGLLLSPLEFAHFRNFMHHITGVIHRALPRRQPLPGIVY